MPSPYDVDHCEQIFSRQVRHYREKLEMKQEALGKAIRVNSKTISAYESEGSILPRIPGLLRLANVLKVGLDDLLREGSDVTPIRSGADSDTVFTDRQKADLEAAAEKTREPIESKAEIDQGQMMIRHRIFGECIIPVEELQDCERIAKSAYEDELARQLRKKIDAAEKKAVYHYEIHLGDQALAKDMGLEEWKDEKLRKEYEGYCALTKDVSSGKRDLLPFHSYREVLFFVYFTKMDPFEIIAADLKDLRLRDLKEKAKSDLYQKMTTELGNACSALLEAEPDEWWPGYESIQVQMSDLVTDTYLRSIGHSKDEIRSRLVDAYASTMTSAEEVGEYLPEDVYFYIYYAAEDIYKKKWGGYATEAILDWHFENLKNQFRVIPPAGWKKQDSASGHENSPNLGG